MKKMMNFIVMGALALSLLGCGSTSKLTGSSDGSEEITFAEFKKVLTPRSRMLPLAGGQESLILLAKPGDKYAKLYTINHATRKFKLRYDAGKNISRIHRDRADRQIFLSIDANGDENYQLFKFNLKSNSVEKIFGTKDRQAGLIETSYDGSKGYISSNHKNKNRYQIYELDFQTLKSRQLTFGKQSFTWATTDPAGRHLALSRMLGNNDQQIYLLNLKTKKLKKLLSAKGTKFSASFFHPKRNELYINTDYQHDRVGCAKINLSRPKEIKWVLVDETKDIQCYYKPKQELSLVVKTFDGRIQVELLKDVLGRPLNIPFPKNSLVSKFAMVPNSTLAVARVMSSSSPGDYYQFDTAMGENAELVRISQLNQSKISNDQFAHSYDLYYKSFDGMKIHGIIYAKKEWVAAKKKRPVILWPHGGPDGQEYHVFHPFFQYWVQKGYVVFAPNFRGSVGYGKLFETLNDKDWGGGHIKDLVYGKRALSQLNYVDANNVFIVGASFGGYSTLSAITQYPDEFKGAVAMVALANLFTFMKSIPQDPAWQGEFKTEIGDPVKDKKLYRERSPYFFAKNIRTPLKIYQAENDIRTVKAEMDSFVEQLKRHKIPVEYEVLEKEGHSIARTESWEKLLQGTVEFLNRQIE